MADVADAPVGPDEEERKKAEARARRLANLLPPCKPGETRNREGKNGRTQRAALVRWLEEPSTDPSMSRIERVWQACYLAALKGSAPDRKTLIEQHGGKPPVAVDMTSSDGSMSPARADGVAAQLRAVIQARKADAEAAKLEPDTGSTDADPTGTG